MGLETSLAPESPLQESPLPETVQFVAPVTAQESLVVPLRRTSEGIALRCCVTESEGVMHTDAPLEQKVGGSQTVRGLVAQVSYCWKIWLPSQ